MHDAFIGINFVLLQLQSNIGLIIHGSFYFTFVQGGEKSGGI